MNYEIDHCDIFIEEDYKEPVNRREEYQKYKERLHPVNVKNKTKWNRVRSNPNAKRSKGLKK